MKKILALVIAVQVMGIAGCAGSPRRSGTVYSSQPVYAQSQASSQDEYNRKVIKQGLVGAATGAIAAEASGGKAGKGALIGAGTNVIGSALLDAITTPQQPQQVQYVQQSRQNFNTDRVIRKYDSNGNVISEEVFTR